MSVYHPRTVRCTCGTSFKHALLESANVERTPAIRDAVLDGTLHRVHCPACGQRVVAEVKFYFADPKRKKLFLVNPSSERFRSRADSDELQRGLKAFPASVMDATNAELRVVYGLDELREKLICQDSGLDDRAVELAKLCIVRDHPFLLNHNRLAIHLTAVKERRMHFVAGHKNRKELFKVQLPVALLDELTAQPPAAPGGKPRSAKAPARPMKQAAGRRFAFDPAKVAPGLFKAGGAAAKRGTRPAKSAAPQLWVNFRELSDRNDAKAALHDMAEAIRKGQAVPLTGAKFHRLLRLLSGNVNSLDNSSKQNLQVVFDYAVQQRNERAQELLTEVRFGVPLDDEWSRNTAKKDIPVLWRVLSQLPASNVTGNIALKRIDISGTDSGGVYDPDTGYITIFGGTATGMAGKRLENFEDTLRHEVGHAVHWREKKKVDDWLKAEFGWEEFTTDTAGILQWASRMGAAAWPPGTSEVLKRKAAAVLAASLPASGWESGPIRDDSAEMAVQDVLGSKACGAAKAWKQSGSDWYEHCDEWFVAGGRRFFINFWYGTFMCVNDTTISLVGKMPSLYAAMSPAEFFAELYALWYDEDDPDRKLVPPAARTWFKKNVG